MNHNPCLIPLRPSPAPTNFSIESSQSFFSISALQSSPEEITMTSISEVTDSGGSIKVFETTNYHQWNDLMSSYFLEHNLDGIVDGSEPQPEGSTPEAKNWILRQKKAAGFISRKLDSSNCDLFLNSETRRDPHKLWRDIELEYASKKARNRSRLFSRFLSLKCCD